MGKFEIKNEGDAAKIYILGEIGEWGGVTAADLIPKIHSIKADNIDLHVDSLGGNVFEATGIFNALQAHPAYKTAYVDGVAASAASYLIQVADKIVMGTGSQLMIHDAEGGYQGNVSGIPAFENLLNTVSTDIAEFYSSRAGGTPAEWRKKMKAETWYTAEEAVKAGLADEVASRVWTPANKINLTLALNNSGYTYKGRENAPDPFATTADNRVETKTSPLSEADLINSIVSAFERGK